MKNKVFALVLSFLLAVALIGCTSDDSDKQTNDTATDNATTQTDSARMRNTQTNRNRSNSSATRGRYFADGKGDVRDDRTDWLGDDVRRIADDVMDGSRRMSTKMGDAVKDMTK